eukprot:CAMPEP_0194284926 /NCGR_PEP_ID=MMETSP0169-20130528/28917_1 /TAXON_ID=218684 /ORGANISM="Corethron pennatum, Strain L29A3" /LENGTH=235 /DNA_ID=CAMNT_0039030905 /DNA_START=267 /DNA_END=971 /DNA_ORIENTATION=+
MNSLDMPMFEAISSAGKKIKKSMPHVRAVILRGEGRAFCSGLDVVSMLKCGMSSFDRLLDRPEDSITNLAQEVAYVWRTLDVPVIAAIHGVCFGGGLQIALGADMRYATPDSKLSILESKWGLIPDMGASITLRELVSIDVAKELTMTGRVISGADASDLNLVTRCVADPLAEALETAREISGRSPDSVAAAKRLYQETWAAGTSNEKILAVETEMQRRLLPSYNQFVASIRNFG